MPPSLLLYFYDMQMTYLTPLKTLALSHNPNALVQLGYAD